MPAWRKAVTVTALACLAVGSPSSASAQADDPWIPPDLPELTEAFDGTRAALEERIARHDGTVGLVLYDPETGEGVSIRGDERFPSASVIKVPVLYEAMLRVEEGRLALDDPLVMLDDDRAAGAGVLQHLTAPYEVNVRDAAFLMTALSDNAATNLLIEKLGARRVTDRMAELGLPETRLFRQSFGEPADSFDPEGSERWGFGVTTPMEQAKLLAWIHRGEAVSPEATDEMLRMLEEQLYQYGLPRHLPPDVEVAHKTGSIAEARHDCGIVFAEAREYVLCVMTRENRDTGYAFDNEAEVLLGDLSRIVYEEVGEP